MEFILHHNFFIFKDRYYLQIRGTAMGATCAPAKLFLGMWEREHIQMDCNDDNGQVLLWLRFIDDFFFIWQGTLVDLHDFISYLNTNNQNIKLTHTISKKTLDILDIRI